MTSLLAFAVVLGVLVVVHELGHYGVARLCGVKVLRFSVGFGKPLVSWRVGPDRTEWAIAAFPLGGYVKMLDEAEGEVAPNEVHRAFNRQTVWRRMAIVVAGPAANFALAILLYWFFFMHGVTGMRAVVAEPLAGTAAAAAGLHNGDMVVAVDGESVTTWQDLRWFLLRQTASDEPVVLAMGGGGVRKLDVHALTPDDMEGDFLAKLGLTPFQPSLPPMIGELVPGDIAARSGLRSGDVVMAVNGEPINHWEEFVRWVKSHPDQALHLDVRRENSSLTVDVVPSGVEVGGKRIGKIGAAPKVDQQQLERLLVEVSYPPHIAFMRAAGKTWDMATFSLEMLGRMVVGQVSWKNLSGPITIADYAGQSARMGWFAFLSFLALISVSLGVLNLLPVPLLDGGHLMYYVVELIKGSPVSEKAMAIGQQVGTAVLLLLMAFAFYNDINRLIAS